MTKQEKYKLRQRLNARRDVQRLAQKEKRERIKKQIEERERAVWQKARDAEAVSRAQEQTLEQAPTQSTTPARNEMDPPAEGN